MPGANGSSHMIAGSDLLVHNRGKNSDLDEWLKDAAEVTLSLSVRPVRDQSEHWMLDLCLCSFQEERQSRRDESIGDDLFR